MIGLFRPVPANANVQVQRVYHYPGRRPLRAMLLFGLGFLLGWYACARHDPMIDHPTHVVAPMHVISPYARE